MRYLPLLDLSNGIKQLPLPDFQAIQLVESSWIDSVAKRDAALLDLIIQSPMLLLWTVSEFLKAGRNEPNRAGGIPDAELEAGFSALIQTNLSLLVRNNVKQMTSIDRLEAASFVDVACFFDLHDDAGSAFGRRVANRLHVIERSLPTVFTSGELTSEYDRKTGSDFQQKSLLAKFLATDFSQSGLRDQLLQNWELELPFFRSGLGGLETRLHRLNELETDFQHLLETEKIAAMRQLAYGASHDVNNPLANISTRAQALLRDETDPKRRQRLITIDAQAFRAHDMISNLMTFAAPPKPNFTRVQLRPIVEAAVGRLQSMAEMQNSQIEIDVDYSIYFDVDRDQLSEMIFATVQNALEALRQGGRVDIRSHWASDESPLRIEIVDNGPGISPDVRRHIFDPFFSGREAGRGLGFGLSKVWRLMELHNGQVRINDTEGGASVELIFPAEQFPVQAAEIEKTA